MSDTYRRFVILGGTILFARSALAKGDDFPVPPILPEKIPPTAAELLDGPPEPPMQFTPDTLANAVAIINATALWRKVAAKNGIYIPDFLHDASYPLRCAIMESKFDPHAQRTRIGKDGKLQFSAFVGYFQFSFHEHTELVNIQVPLLNFLNDPEVRSRIAPYSDRKPEELLEFKDLCNERLLSRPEVQVGALMFSAIQRAEGVVVFAAPKHLNDAQIQACLYLGHQLETALKKIIDAYDSPLRMLALMPDKEELIRANKPVYGYDYTLTPSQVVQNILRHIDPSLIKLTDLIPGLQIHPDNLYRPIYLAPTRQPLELAK